MKRLLFLVMLALSATCSYAQLNTDRMLSVGRNALYFEDYVLSIQYFNQILKVKPYLTEPYLYRGIAKINLEDYDGAIKDISEVINRNPFIPLAYYARAFSYKRVGEFAKAEIDLNKALEFSPENTTFILNRLEVYEHEKKYEALVSDLDFLIRRNPQMFDLWFEKARVMLLTGDTLSSIDCFNKVIELDRENPDAWGGRATVRLMLHDDSLALNDFNQAIKLKSRNPAHYINRGILYYFDKNYRGALADYGKAIELDPKNEQALYNRSLLRTEVGDYNNAIEDLSMLIELKPDFYEAIYQRAVVNTDLGMLKEAIADYTSIIERYPTFVPAYYGRSRAYERMNDSKRSYLDLEKAYAITEQQKNKKKTDKKEFDTSVKLAKEESTISERAKLFNASATNKDQDNASTSIRGSVQNRFVEAIPEKNFVLSFYERDNSLRRPNRYVDLLANYNRRNTLPAKLKIVSHEASLTNSLIEFHFHSIDLLSDRIQNNPTNPDLYFAQAIDYALVQDFSSAINDLNNAIQLNSNFTLAYFSRANIRFKMVEFAQNNVESLELAETTKTTTKQTGSANKSVNTTQPTNKHKFEFEMIMRDYDKVIELAPDFAYAWYNRGNMLLEMKDFRSAIQNYSRAIELDSDLAEAYYNRGLTYIFLGETTNGVNDLSKAGELGIYQAYNLLKRMR